MSPWLIAALVGLTFAVLQYGGRDFRMGAGALVPTFLRVAAIALLIALLLDAPAGRAKPLPTWVALDASASWQRDRDSVSWRKAWSEVRAARPESLFLFGDSLRAARLGDNVASPTDLASLARPAVERALGRGHPLVVVTDGEL